VYVPAATLLPTWIVKVEEPEPPVTLVGLREAVGPVGETEAVSATLPAKLLLGIILTVVEPLAPAVIDNEFCPAVMSKSDVPAGVTVT